MTKTFSISDRTLAAIAAVLESAELEVLAHGEERKDVPALRHERDAEVGPRPRRKPREVAAAETDRTAARNERAGDGAQGRRLSGAVGADQCDDLALGDLEREVAAHHRFAIGELQPFRGEERGHAVAPPR